jgi:hypothetical protein
LELFERDLKVWTTNGLLDEVGSNPFWQAEAEAGEQVGLRLVGSAHATQSEFAAVGQRQDYVPSLDGRQGGEDFSRAHVDARVMREAVQRAVHGVRDEAHEHVGFIATLDLVKDRTNADVLLEGPRGRCGPRRDLSARARD